MVRFFYVFNSTASAAILNSRLKTRTQDRGVLRSLTSLVPSTSQYIRSSVHVSHYLMYTTRTQPGGRYPSSVDLGQN
jgi:hypothetical protein